MALYSASFFFPLRDRLKAANPADSWGKPRRASRATRFSRSIAAVCGSQSEYACIRCCNNDAKCGCADGLSSAKKRVVLRDNSRSLYSALNPNASSATLTPTALEVLYNANGARANGWAGDADRL